MKQIQFKSKRTASVGSQKPQMVGNNALKTKTRMVNDNVINIQTSGKSLNTKIDLKADMINNKPVFKTGDNCKNRTVKRGYLNTDEANVFLNVFACIQLIEGVRSLESKESPAI